MFLGLSGIFIAILLIIFLTHRKWKLGWAMLTASLIVAIFNGFKPLFALEVFWGALTNTTTIFLALVITAITIFGFLLQETGYLEDTIKNLTRVVSDFRVLLMVIPALVAMLTIPGGAVFSAPMMDPLGKELNMRPATVSAANVFFRHLIYSIVPFYSSLILMAQLSQVDIFVFIRYNTPLLLVGGLFAYFYYFHNVPRTAGAGDGAGINLENIKALFISFFPFVIILVLGIGFKMYFPLAILISIIYIVILGNPAAQKTSSPRERAAMIWPGIDWFMILAIMGIMVFKDFVQVSGALDALSVLLLDLGIPLLLLVVLFPLLTGLVTGNNTASVAISVPLFLPLLPAGALGEVYLAIMFVSSLMGYQVSPFHLCLVLSTEYFKAPLTQVIKEILVPSLMVIAIAMIPLIFY